MYIKGASRRSVAFWSRHLQDLKENVRAEVIEKRGLAADDLRDMMLEMQQDARLTRCKNFMYIASFNPCPHEHPTERQWERMYEIFEKQRGIPEGQQRIVIEHEKEGRTHRHVVWNRIDLGKMRAFPDGLNPKICEAAANEIELTLGFERTARLLDRDPEKSKRRNPKSYEMFRGMKSGLDPRGITAEITAIFRGSENGADFVEGLRQHGYQLVEGNRAFCIMDSAGHEHSLARRIDGINTRELRAFMEGVDLHGIPTVEQARVQYRDKKIAGLEADRDTVRHEIEWEEALAKAAIEKEQRERCFVEPGQERKRQDSREKEWPLAPPLPERTTTSPGYHFEDFGREATRDSRRHEPPDNLRGAAKQIWTAYHHSDNAKAFTAALDEQGISLASVTKEEAERSRKDAQEARKKGAYAPRYREGEIVAIAEPGMAYGPEGKINEPRVTRLNDRTTGRSLPEIEKFLKGLDRSEMLGIDATKTLLKARVEQRISEVQGFRDMLRDNRNAERMKRAQQPGYMRSTTGRNLKKVLTEVTGIRRPPVPLKTSVDTLGKALGAAGKLAEGLFELIDPVLTPAQKREKEIAARVREAEAAGTTDLARYVAEREKERERER